MLQPCQLIAPAHRALPALCPGRCQLPLHPGRCQLPLHPGRCQLPCNVPGETLNPAAWKTKIIFVVSQLVYTIALLLPGKLLHSSYFLHTIWLMYIFATCVWNGAGYYIEALQRWHSCPAYHSYLCHGLYALCSCLCHGIYALCSCLCHGIYALSSCLCHGIYAPSRCSAGGTQRWHSPIRLTKLMGTTILVSAVMMPE